MTTYKLIKKDGSYYVQGHKTWTGEEDSILIYQYPAGDYDLVKAKGKLMHGALYDLYQTSEQLHDGDNFSLNGKIVYQCEGVHVVEVKHA